MVYKVVTIHQEWNWPKQLPSSLVLSCTFSNSITSYGYPHKIVFTWSTNFRYGKRSYLIYWLFQRLPYTERDHPPWCRSQWPPWLGSVGVVRDRADSTRLARYTSLRIRTHDPSSTHDRSAPVKQTLRSVRVLYCNKVSLLVSFWHRQILMKRNYLSWF